jgi:hypothetical protein
MPVTAPIPGSRAGSATRGTPAWDGFPPRTSRPPTHERTGLGQGVRGKQDRAQQVLSSPRCREEFLPRLDESHHVFQERNLLVGLLEDQGWPVFRGARSPRDGSRGRGEREPPGPTLTRSARGSSTTATSPLPTRCSTSWRIMASPWRRLPSPGCSNTVVAAPIVGATNSHHLPDAVAALDLELSDEEVRTLEQPYTARQATGF